MNRSWLAAVAACLIATATTGEAAGDPTTFESGQAAVARESARTPLDRRAKNVILFLGDGLGVSTVTAARILEGQLRGKSGEENLLAPARRRAPA
jgi:alkaline phosphatase